MLMIAGAIVFTVGTICNVITHDRYLVLYAVGGLCLTACILALGMFESTAIQFGMDQMLRLHQISLAPSYSGTIGPVS